MLIAVVADAENDVLADVNESAAQPASSSDAVSTATSSSQQQHQHMLLQCDSRLAGEALPVMMLAARNCTVFECLHAIEFWGRYECRCQVVDHSAQGALQLSERMISQSINHILFANMKNYIQQFC